MMNESKKNLITCTYYQAGMILITSLFFCLFIFIGGYFLGYKKAAQEFSCYLEQDSLADHIYSSMCIWSDTKYENGADDEVEEVIE